MQGIGTPRNKWTISVKWGGTTNRSFYDEWGRGFDDEADAGLDDDV